MNYKVDTTRRTGPERRSADARGSVERRSVLADQGSYINIIQKIPLFKGLRLSQFKEILRICSQQLFRPQDMVIHDRAESSEMFILIKGMLKVVLPDASELSRIKPVEIVGEMGVFTGEIRSATVVAGEQSMVLTIRKKELLHLFRRDSELGVIVLTNVIRGLASKVRKSNSLIDELKKASDSEVDFGNIFDGWDDKNDDDL